MCQVLCLGLSHGLLTFLAIVFLCWGSITSLFHPSSRVSMFDAMRPGCQQHVCMSVKTHITQHIPVYTDSCAIELAYKTAEDSCGVSCVPVAEEPPLCQGPELGATPGYVTEPSSLNSR